MIPDAMRHEGYSLVLGLTEEKIITSKVEAKLYYDVISCFGQQNCFGQQKSRADVPPKFTGPRRPVTVTLSEDTLAWLATVDPDGARAIVRVTDAAMPLDAKPDKQVELVAVMPGLAIIIVGPSQLLQKIEWLRLVEVAPMRFLLTIPLGTSIDSLELAIIDLLEEAKPYNNWEHSLLSQLRDLIRRVRRQGELLKAEMLFIGTRAMGGGTDAEPGPEASKG